MTAILGVIVLLAALLGAAFAAGLCLGRASGDSARTYSGLRVQLRWMTTERDCWKGLAVRLHREGRCQHAFLEEAFGGGSTEAARAAQTRRRKGEVLS